MPRKKQRAGADGCPGGRLRGIVRHSLRLEAIFRGCFSRDFPGMPLPNGQPSMSVHDEESDHIMSRGVRDGS